MLAIRDRKLDPVPDQIQPHWRSPHSTIVQGNDGWTLKARLVDDAGIIHGLKGFVV